MPAAGRETLTRRRVVEAAVRLADAEGLEAVTMRHLATGLGVVPMALYKHVSGKDDLVAAMVDALIDDMAVAPPAVAGQWQRGLREALHGARRVITLHPWGRRAIEAQTERTAAVLGHMERVSAIFLAAGFSADLTHHVMHLLGNRIWGFSPELFAGSPQPSGAPRRGRSTAAPPLDPADYPSILAISSEARARRPRATGCDEDFEFDFALDVLVRGISRLRRQGWTSPADRGR